MANPDSRPDSLAGTLAQTVARVLPGSRRQRAADEAVAIAALRSDRFRQEREPDWKRLDAIVTRLERGRLRGLSDDDLLALPALYRMAASSLSVARETSLDAATLAWLEALVQRAWFQLYGPRQGLGRWLARWLGGGLSRAVREIWPDLLVALAVMAAGTVVGWLLCRADSSWYFSLFPGDGDVRVPGASREVLYRSLYGGQDQDGLSAFAAYLFSHNAQIAILAFALGFAFGIPSLLLLVQNTATLGAMLWLFDSQGLLPDLIGWLSVHGTTELSAILLSGAAGLHIGRAVAFPGTRSVLDSAAEAGRRAATVMAGVVLMLMVAAVLEGFFRQLINDLPARLTLGWGVFLFWLWYFFAFRRDPGKLA
jgi:uncharacterized membrane protein SpoIIM required for sporulation